MIVAEIHPACWGLETDYLHFLGALGWLLNGGLALFFVSPRDDAGAPMTGRGCRFAVAGSFLLFAVACAAGVLDAYGHLLTEFRKAGVVAQTAAVGAALAGVAVLPAPGWIARRLSGAWVRWTPPALAGASALLLLAWPGLVAWWLVIACGGAGAYLCGSPAGRFRPRLGEVGALTVERLFGAALLVIALAWGAPQVLESSSAWPEPDRSAARIVGIFQGIVLAAGAWCIFGALWVLYLREHTLPHVRMRRGVLGLRPAMIFPAIESAVVVAGFFLTQSGASHVEDYVERRLLTEIRAVASSVNWDMVDREGVPVDGADPVRIRGQLARLLGASPSYQAAALWVVDGDAPRVLAAVNSAPPDAGIDEKSLLPPLAQTWARIPAPRSTIEWLDVPVRYSWARAVVPSEQFLGGRGEWLLTLAVDSRGLADPVAAHRLQSLAIVALVAVLMGFAVVLSVRALNEAELRALKDRAEAENRTKTEFLAMVSHEVRTPLQSVLGFAELAEAEAQSETAARHVRAVRTQGAILLRIIQDILDFSALRSGQLHLVPETVSLRHLVLDVQRAFAERVRAKGLTLTVDCSDDVPSWVMVDRVRLSQVLGNLVGNAVKFTQRGGVRVALSVADTSADAAEIQFTVSDTGAGIPADQMRRIFEPFRKLRDDDTPVAGGVGLGLAICRQVVDLLGGEITAESEEGEGAAFRFRLRLLLANGPAIAAPAMPCSVPEAGVPTLAGLRVLLVDDNPHVRELLREFLRRLGAAVTARPDGRSALVAMRGQRFDVALLDLRLPDMDITTLVGAVRDMTGSPDAPWLVGISAGVSDLEIQQALEHGLNDFILKPVSMSGLAETIRMSPVAERITEMPGALEPTVEPTAEVRRAFFGEVGPVLARIERFCRDAHGTRAAAEAHYLANGCLMLGLDEALALCREVEKSAEAEQLGEALIQVRRLRAALESAGSPDEATRV